MCRTARSSSPADISARYHTAVQLHVQLPEAVKQMLKVVAETAWRPTDLNLLSSLYRNPAMTDGRSAKVVDYQMEDILRKWESFDTQDQVLTADGNALN